MGIETKNPRCARGVAIVLAAAVALLISGCSEAPQPLPTPTDGSSTRTPAPSASPTPDRPQPSSSAPAVAVPPADTDHPSTEQLEGVQAFVVRPDVLELRELGGEVVTTLSYMSSPADAIATLSTVFGEPPVDEEYRGTNHTPPGIRHSWGTLVLDERFYDEQRRVEENLDYLVWPRFAIQLDGPASNGMPLSSVQGIQAGDSWDFATSSPGFQSDVFTCAGTAVEVLDIERPDGGAAQATVVVLESDDATVFRVAAPEMVADGCA